MLRLLLAALAFTTTILTAAGEIRINEFVALNRSGLEDEEGDFVDWIELTNSGDTTAIMSGWYLSDDPDDLEKWPLPEITFAPGDFRLVLASGKDRRDVSGEWHTNFKLRSEGEFLALTDAGGRIVDSLDPAYPVQVPDIAYGRDVRGNFRYWLTPTPGQGNATDAGDGVLVLPGHDIADRVPMAETDVDYNVYARVLASSNGVAGVVCRYRVQYKAELEAELRDDGIVPDIVANDGLYSGALPARTLFGPRWNPGEMIRWRLVATDIDGHEGHWPPWTDEEDRPEYLGTVVVNSEEQSDLPVLHWFAEDPERAVTGTGSFSSAYFDGRFYDHFHVRRRGQFGAIQWAKPKLKFDFNPGHHFRYDLKRRLVEEFNLQSHFADASTMRENIAFQFFNDAGTPAPQTRHWQVRLNGEYYGLFSFIEQIDTDFLRQQGLDADGVMYKANGFPSTLAVGVTPALYQKETRKDEPYDDLIAFTNGINGKGDLSRNDYIMDQVNLPAMVNEMACQAILKNADRLTKNYYIYRNPETDLWQRIPWDLDGAFSMSASLDTENFASPLYGDSEHTQAPNQAIYQNFLLDAILDSSATREMYLRRLRTLIDTFLTEDLSYFAPRLDQTLALIENEAARDAAKWSRGNARSEVEAIKTRQLPERRAQLLERYGPSGQGLVPHPQSQGLSIEIGAIDVKPTDAPTAEFIELLNLNDEAVDISGWKLTDAVAFVFPPGTVIPKRGNVFQPDRHKLYVVKDMDAFRQRTIAPTGGQGLFMLGPFDGRLSTRGESIRLWDAQGTLIAEKTYEAFEPSVPLPEAVKNLRPEIRWSNGAYQLHYWQGHDAAYAVHVEHSTDLRSWTLLTVNPSVAASNDVSRQMLVTLDPESEQGYLRLRITAAP